MKTALSDQPLARLVLFVDIFRVLLMVVSMVTPVATIASGAEAGALEGFLLVLRVGE